MAEQSEMRLGRIQRTARLPALVAGDLADQIKFGQIKPGDRLPTEPELAERFGVSRTVVREALARLKSDGFVRSRQGAGVFVSDRPQAALRIDHELLLDRSRFAQLFELRATLEIKAAGLAAERHSAETIEVLRATLKRLQDASGSDPASLAADLDFHCAVAFAADNPFMAEFVRFISSEIREAIAVTRAHRDPDASAKKTYLEHSAIFDAICRSDATDARRAMRKHLSNGLARLSA